MRTHTALTTISACLVIGFAGCGGDDGKDEPATTGTTDQATTQTTPQRDPAVKREMGLAIGGYNRGYRKFRAAIAQNSGSLDRLKADIAEYRTVIFEFDKELRAIDFDDSLVPQVNSILESNRRLIAQLDAMADARSFDAVTSQFEEFQKDRTPTIDAVNGLMRQL